MPNGDALKLSAKPLGVKTILAVSLLLVCAALSQGQSPESDPAHHIAIELRAVPGMDFSHPAYHLILLDDGSVSFEYFRKGKKRESHSRLTQEQTRKLLTFIDRMGFFEFRHNNVESVSDASYMTLYVHYVSRERLLRVYDFEKGVPLSLDKIQREILRVTNTTSLVGKHAIPKRPGS